jgi:hypothetical protein
MKKLLALGLLATIFSPFMARIANADDHPDKDRKHWKKVSDPDKDGKRWKKVSDPDKDGEHWKKVSATEMVDVGLSSAVIVAGLGYLTLRRRIHTHN